jgi:hypothetical protein
MVGCVAGSYSKIRNVSSDQKIAPVDSSDAQIYRVEGEMALREWWHELDAAGEDIFSAIAVRKNILPRWRKRREKRVGY